MAADEWEVRKDGSRACYVKKTTDSNAKVPTPTDSKKYKSEKEACEAAKKLKGLHCDSYLDYSPRDCKNKYQVSLD
jgi:hypothetical protein